MLRDRLEGTSSHPRIITRLRGKADSLGVPTTARPASVTRPELLGAVVPCCLSPECALLAEMIMNPQKVVSECGDIDETVPGAPTRVISPILSSHRNSHKSECTTCRIHISSALTKPGLVGTWFGPFWKMCFIPPGAQHRKLSHCGHFMPWK